MTTLLDVENLANPAPAVQSNFEALDPLVTRIAIGTGVPSSSLPASKLLFLRTDIGSGIPVIYARENGTWVAK